MTSVLATPDRVFLIAERGGADLFGWMHAEDDVAGPERDSAADDRSPRERGGDDGDDGGAAEEGGVPKRTVRLTDARSIVAQVRRRSKK